MKKSVLALAMAFGVTSAFAQDLTSKKGEPILPEAGDWSIGIDATPFLKYAGNMLSSAGNVAPTWDNLNTNQTIVGKMMKDEKTAYRAILRLGHSGSTSRAQIADPNASAPSFPALGTMKEDKWKHGSNFIGLGAGIEKRRGKTRLQGFYGADAMLWISSSKDKYTYGNALVAGGSAPVGVGSSTNFGSNITSDTYGNAARVTTKKSGSTIGFGVRGFIGAEYFILPKLAIGGEFGWGLGISMTGASTTSTESIGGTGPSIGTQEIKGNKSSGLTLDTDKNAFGTASGALRMNLYF